MCLAIPGKILDTAEKNHVRHGRVNFGGVVRDVCLDFVPEAEVGDYVIVHVGFAISRVDADEAQKTFETLRQMGMLESELQSEVAGDETAGSEEAADAGGSRGERG
jgi:hydrogenase expression/formation protein HypC